MTATTSVVIKRNGQPEERDIAKVQRVLAWATTGYNDDSLTPIDDVSASTIELRANIQYYPGMPTSEVHASLVLAAEQLIREESPNYDHVAARLLWFSLRKEAYNSHRVPSIYSLVKTGVAEGYYDPELLQVYTEEDWRGMDILVDHRRDDLLRYAGVRQVQNKYAIHDKTGRIRETPQVVYLMAAATLYQNYPRESRLGWISRYYNQLSLQKVSLPSPVMNGVRTPSRQFSSCVLIDAADELTSIGAVGTAALMYGAKRAGLGINMGRLRAEGQNVAGGLFKAAGPVPFFKFERSAVKGCSQSGMRAASATMNYPFWHLDFFTLIELKNNKGTEDERVRNVDYCVHLNRIIFERIADDGYLTLFSPEEVPELYEAFYSSDIDRFRQLYEKAEANPDLTKKQVPVMQLVNKLLIERWETGRIYIMFADTANRQTPIEEPIYMTNLCFGGENRLLTENGYVTMEEAYRMGGESTYAQREHGSLRVVNRHGVVPATQVYKVDDSAALYTVKYKSGRSVTATSDHQHIMVDGSRKTTKDLAVGDAVPVLLDGHHFGTRHDPFYAELAGAVIGDGSLAVARGKHLVAMLRSWDNPALIEHWVDILNKWRAEHGKEPVSAFCAQHMVEFDYIRYTKSSHFLGQALAEDGLWQRDKHKVPASIWNSDRETVAAFLRGLFDTDGHFQANPRGGAAVVLNQAHAKLLSEVQTLLGWLGIDSRILSDKPRDTPDSTKAGRKVWGKRQAYRLFITRRVNLARFQELVGFADSSKLAKLTQYLEAHAGSRNSNNANQDYIESVTFDRMDSTYCLTEPDNNEVVVNGVVIGQCVEILQHTSPIDAFDQARGLIALCTLSAINWANIKSLADMSEACELAVRALDELLDYQDYLHPAARRHTQMYRPLGVGVINFAYWYQAQGFRWGEGLEEVSRMAEMQYYCLMKANVQLAKEKGPCERPGKYAKGWLAFDESAIPVKLYLGEKLWNELRADMIKYGVRFATVAALMPSEASSIVSNALNGTEPPRALVTNKGSEDGRYPQVAPGIGVVDYQLGWDIFARDYLTTLARFQPFTDQGMSANTTYDARHYPGQQVTLDQLLDDITMAYELGYKTLYYNNQNKVQKIGTDAGVDMAPMPISMVEPESVATEFEMGCGSGACAI